MFLKALDEGFVPAGEGAQSLLYQSDKFEESELLDALASVASKYDLADFDEPSLRDHIEADRKVIQEIIDLVRPITPDNDSKFQKLKLGLRNEIPKRQAVQPWARPA